MNMAVDVKLLDQCGLVPLCRVPEVLDQRSSIEQKVDLNTGSGLVEGLVMLLEDLTPFRFMTIQMIVKSILDFSHDGTERVLSPKLTS
jgi:hypothetical protein